MSFLRSLQSFVGMFHGLFGMLMAAEMIFFAMVYGCGAVGMGRLFVKLRSSLMRIIWHGEFRPRLPGYFKTVRQSRLCKKIHIRECR